MLSLFDHRELLILGGCHVHLFVHTCMHAWICMKIRLHLLNVLKPQHRFHIEKPKLLREVQSFRKFGYKAVKFGGLLRSQNKNFKSRQCGLNQVNANFHTL